MLIQTIGNDDANLLIRRLGLSAGLASLFYSTGNEYDQIRQKYELIRRVGKSKNADIKRSYGVFYCKDVIANRMTYLWCILLLYYNYTVHRECHNYVVKGLFNIDPARLPIQHFLPF